MVRLGYSWALLLSNFDRSSRTPYNLISLLQFDALIQCGPSARLPFAVNRRSSDKAYVIGRVVLSAVGRHLFWILFFSRRVPKFTSKSRTSPAASLRLPRARAIPQSPRQVAHLLACKLGTAPPSKGFSGKRGRGVRKDLLPGGYISPAHALRAALRKAKSYLAAQDVASSTRSKYTNTYKFWVELCRACGSSPLLTGKCPKDDAKLLTDYVMYEYAGHGNKHGTILQKLS